MSHRAKIRLNRPLMVVAALSLGVLTACSALGGLMGGGEPAPVEEVPVVEEPVVEVLPPTAVPPTPTLELPTEIPTATPMLLGEPTEAAEEEATEEEVAEGEPTPTPLGTPLAVEATPLGGAEAEATPGEEEGMGTGGGTTAEAEAEETVTPEAEATATEEAEATPAAPATPVTVTYTVKAGDTLGEIAKAYGTTAAEIVSLNQAKYPSLKDNPDRILVGWVLTLPSTVGSNTYTVQQADVLLEIAREHGTTAEVIISLNEDRYPSLRTNPGWLEIGWVLRMP